MTPTDHHLLPQNRPLYTEKPSQEDWRRPQLNAPVERRTKHQNITCSPAHSTTKQGNRYDPLVCPSKPSSGGLQKICSWHPSMWHSWERGSSQCNHHIECREEEEDNGKALCSTVSKNWWEYIEAIHSDNFFSIFDTSLFAQLHPRPIALSNPVLFLSLPMCMSVCSSVSVCVCVWMERGGDRRGGVYVNASVCMFTCPCPTPPVFASVVDCWQTSCYCFHLNKRWLYVSCQCLWCILQHGIAATEWRKTKHPHN